MDYLNLPRLLTFPSGQAVLDELERRGLGGLRTLRGLGADTGRVVAAAQAAFGGWHDLACPLDEAALTTDRPGTVVEFSRTFYLKNIPDADDSPKPLSRDVLADPHVWTQLEDQRFVLRVDPNWITTSSAFSSGSPAKLAGLAVVVSVSSELAVGSPVVLGLPMTDAVAWFYEENWEPTGGQ